jgi:FKBP-type peptidyl-prolyl cis-trans isomerase FkpA
MKKYLGIILLVTVAFSSCSKKDTFDPVAQAANDDVLIKAYLAAHPTINATKDASGLYYQIVTQGTGSNANSASTVTANYSGTLLDGTVFDKGTNFSFSLASVIDGWKIGIPLVKSGGRILLLIPSGLGYGNSAAGSIPANSVLLFTIDVLSVK